MEDTTLSKGAWQREQHALLALNSLKAVRSSARTQITGWFKKPTAHRPANHTVGRFFIARRERRLLIPRGSAFAKKLPVTGLLFFAGQGGRANHFFHTCFTSALPRAEGVYRSARGCIDSMCMWSLSCFGRANNHQCGKSSLDPLQFWPELEKKQNSSPAQYSEPPTCKLTSHSLPSFASSSFH